MVNLTEIAIDSAMNTQTFQLILAQLAILIFATMVVVSPVPPRFVFSVALMLGFMLSFSVGSSLALADKIRQAEADEIRKQHTASLGTYLGGAICYLVLLNFMLDKIL